MAVEPLASKCGVLGYDLGIAPCDCCFGWIRFGYWAGRGEGSDDCNVLNHVLKLCGASASLSTL